MINQSLTSEEEQIVADFESGAYQSVKALDVEKKRHARIAKNTLEKSANISIRLPKRDIFRIKARAVEKGIPYQTIISSLIHQYAFGKIRLEI